MNLNKDIYQYGLVKYALDHGGSIHPLIIPPEYTNGTGLMNPSILIHNDEILINIRHVNYTLYHSEGKTFQHKYGPLQYLHPENDVTLRTKNFICTLNQNYEVDKIYPVNTSKLDIEPIWEFIGLEDARLCYWDNKLYMTGVRRDTTTHGEGRMELSEVIREGNEYKEISRTRIPAPGANDTYCEKNWMPILDSPFHYVKWTNPTEIVFYDKENKTTISEIKNHYIPCDYDFRGGSQIINIAGYNLAIIHDLNLFKSEQGNKDALYRHRFVVWDKDFNLLDFSDRFSFMDGDIEFSCGMALQDRNLLITFGFQDNAAFLLKLPIETIGFY